MNKLTLIIILIFSTTVVFGQRDFLVLKKRNKKMAFFMKDSYITFRLKSGEWISGNITKVVNDSFYVRRMSIRRSMMGSDTVHFGIWPVALGDVAAMPRMGEQIVFVDDQVKISLGDEHWVWVKNGLLFMILGGGYTFLNTTNTLIQKDPLLARSNIGKLGIGVAVFLVGELLHHAYHPVLLMGKKYHLQTIKI